MKPTEVLAGDRPRYFESGWMQHEDGRVGLVTSAGNRNAIVMWGSSGINREEVAWGRLLPYYPEGRCINVYQTGICVDRRARQTARRTCSMTHYEVSWSPPTNRLIIDDRIIWALIEYSTYPTLDDAVRMLENHEVPSVAITRDLILHTPSGREQDTEVIYRTVPVGKLINGTFVPEWEGSCYTKLARLALQEEGLPCL